MKKSLENKIALTIPTGRSRIKNVVKSFVENAELYGYNPKDISVYLSIDTEYQNTHKEDFFLDLELKNKLNNIQYIGPIERMSIASEMVSKCGMNSEIANSSFAKRGYSPQRNSALLMAVRDKNDYVICFDDDESPIIPVERGKGEIIWKNLDFFTPHLNALKNGADVTRGPYMGYISPIPSDFEKDIPEEIRMKLGEALQYGNDVITRHSFFNLMNQIKYLPNNELMNPSRPFVVEMDKNGKHIYAGNMGINLKSLKEGRIPLFYTPPKARGEDTIFALQLKNTKVVEVGSYIFHDPFNMYPKVLEGEYPERLKNILVNQDTKKRFSDALTGWLKYAPILIYMTSEDEKERNNRMREMVSKIEYPTIQLAKVLNCPEIAESKNILKNYVQNVESHFLELTETQSEWRSILDKI